MLPPGRDRLWIKPSPMGSATPTNTIGMLEVADFSAAADCEFPAIVRSGLSAASSAARAGKRSWDRPKRYSITRLLPSTQPWFRRPPSQAFCQVGISSLTARKPTRRRVCCASTLRDETSSAAVVAMNSRRLIGCPCPLDDRSSVGRFRQKAKRLDVFLGSKADVERLLAEVRLTPQQTSQSATEANGDATRCTITSAAQCKFASANSRRRRYPGRKRKLCWSAPRRRTPFYTAEHEAFRDVLRRFVGARSSPMPAWDEADEFPRTLYRQGRRSGCWDSAFPKRTAASPRPFLDRRRGGAGSGRGRRRFGAA